ncbi:MAG: protoheme farnesyltransferase [Phycisphaerales bacterium]|nr:protoheme farnesyltransferase [Phycisphaerales bacterium]
MKLDPDRSDLSPALVALTGGALVVPSGPGTAPAAPSTDEEAGGRPALERHTRWSDFSELAKLRLNFLVMVTTVVGYALAKPDWSDWRLLVHALLGTALTATGASILNQVIERRHDALMNRTKRRPLPGGRVRVGDALALGLGTGAVGVAELYYFVNPLTALIGAITLGTYVLIYTPLKRVTTLNTVVGAIPGALPPVMGVAAAAGHGLVYGQTFLGVQPIGWALFGILFFWQMPHFLAIAILYREDYARGGFVMLPVVDEDLVATSRQMLFYALALIPVTLVPTLLGATGLLYFLAALAMGLAFLGFAVVCVMTRRRGDARQVFLASILYLPCLLAAMMMDRM